MKVGESSPLYETHSCLHENDGARLDRSLMTVLRYGDISGETAMKAICLVAANEKR